MVVQENQDNRVYLDSHVLQKDMRIRMPKEIVHNLNAVPGITHFNIYFDLSKKEIVLTVNNRPEDI